MLSTGIIKAQIQKINFESDGISLNAYMYEAEGEGLKPTIIWCHGNPGSTELGESQMAKKLNDKGINVFRFNYQGLWGNKGDFTLSNSLTDLTHAISYLYQSDNVQEFNIDTSKLVIAGYSFGSTVTLIAALNDNRVKDVIVLGLADHSHFAREFMDPNSKIRAFLEATRDALFLPNGVVKQDPNIFIDDLTNNIYKYDFVLKSELLLDNRILFVVGLNDQVCPIESHFIPLYRSLKEQNHDAITVKLFETNHSFPTKDVGDLSEIFVEWILNQ